NLAIFKSNNFTTLQKEEFLYFYINRPDNVTEIELWEKLLKWSTILSDSLLPDVSQYTENHFATLKKIIKPFIKYIDFTSVRKHDFYQKIHPYAWKASVDIKYNKNYDLKTR
ncbi:29808_t:CDS:1, partial [Gigaspora margarita]